jgi:hypothetical protein
MKRSTITIARNDMEYKAYNKVIQVNGIDVKVSIKITVEEEQDYTETEQITPQPNTFFGVVTVTASAHALEGWDCLGGNSLYCNNMFDSTPFNKSVDQVIAEYDMERTAINDLIGRLTSEYTRLTNLANIYKPFAI